MQVCSCCHAAVWCLSLLTLTHRSDFPRDSTAVASGAVCCAYILLYFVRSIYRKSSPNLFGKSPRLGEWGCFGTPLGEWTTLSLVVKRESKDEMKLSMTMNGVTREAKDKIKSSDKTAIKQVNAIAIGYPNGRHYTYVDLADVVHHATVV